MKTVALMGIFLGLMALFGCGAKDGKDGANGAIGSNGTNGAAGITVKSGIRCLKTDAGSGTSLILQYESVLYTTGDRYVEAEIITDKTYSTSQYYPASATVPVSTGRVFINYNLSGDPSGSLWRIQLAGTTAQFIYSNPGGAHDFYTYTFVAGDCTFF